MATDDAPLREPRESRSVADTLRFGEELAARLPPGSVLLLTGDLGAGKTHLVKGLALGLGLDPDAILSPSFTLVNVHENPGGVGLVHVDLYRLGDVSELRELGLEELPGAERVAAVEWSERLEGRASPGCWQLRIEERGEDLRELVLSPPPAGSRPPAAIL